MISKVVASQLLHPTRVGGLLRLASHRFATPPTSSATTRFYSFAAAASRSNVVKTPILTVAPRSISSSVAYSSVIGGRTIRYTTRYTHMSTSTVVAKSAMSTTPVIASDKLVGVWLLGVAGAVFAMVVLGGITRLTRSGLSMTDWKLQGGMPPRNTQEWEAEFNRYKSFPEYKLTNQSMTLDEFKQIYYMEWFHRMWGRMLGVVFGVPAAIFVATGRTKRFPGMNRALFGMFCLGGLQGLIGWWMVKSGLEEEHLVNRSDPRVSPYRLTMHLSMATVLYSALVWTGLTALNPNRISAVSNAIQKLRRVSVIPSALVAITFLSGAFVAGNDAGRAYNDWPKYAGYWVPQDLWNESLEPAWRNFTEHTAMVQFDHRNLAYTTTLALLTLFGIARGQKAHLTPAIRSGAHALVAVVAVQVTLGISTLMMYVPVSLGAAHQAGALSLWTAVLYFQHTLRYIR